MNEVSCYPKIWNWEYMLWRNLIAEFGVLYWVKKLRWIIYKEKKNHKSNVLRI